MSDDMNFNEVEETAKETDDYTEVSSSAEPENETVTGNAAEPENETVTESTVEKENVPETGSAPVPDTWYDNDEEKPQKSKKGSVILWVGMAVVLVAAVILTTLLVLISIKKKNGSIPSDASIGESFSLLFKGEDKTAENTDKTEKDGSTEKKEIVITPDTADDGADDKADDKTGNAADDTPAGTEAVTPEPKPEFKVTTVLGQYKGIEVDYAPVPVTDEEIESEIQFFIEENATQNEITDRPAQMGDDVVFSCIGTVDNVVNDNCTLTDYDLTLGSGEMIPGFEEGFVGHNAGETFKVALTFPEDYYEDMAGKDVVFDITLSSISESILPELTDELVASKTDCKTIEEYKNSIREDLEEEAALDADDEANVNVVSKVIENTTFEGEIQEEIDWTTEDLIEYYDMMANSYYGMGGAELYSAMYGMDEASYREMMAEQAAQQVKLQHILDQIVIEEGLTCSEEEFNETFESIFYDQYGFTTPEEVYENISEEEAKEYINSYVLSEKAQKIITDSAVFNGR